MRGSSETFRQRRHSGREKRNTPKLTHSNTGLPTQKNGAAKQGEVGTGAGTNRRPARPSTRSETIQAQKNDSPGQKSSQTSESSQTGRTRRRRPARASRNTARTIVSPSECTGPFPRRDGLGKETHDLPPGLETGKSVAGLTHHDRAVDQRLLKGRVGVWRHRLLRDEGRQGGEWAVGYSEFERLWDIPIEGRLPRISPYFLMLTPWSRRHWTASSPREIDING